MIAVTSASFIFCREMLFSQLNSSICSLMVTICDAIASYVSAKLFKWSIKMNKRGKFNEFER